MAKKAKTYKGKSLKPGGGGSFAKLKDKIESKGESAHEAAAVAAKVGREKFGAKKMAKFAAAGKHRAEEKKEGGYKGHPYARKIG